jgi:hypothetical protein
VLPSSCCWRSATSRRLAPFSHRSASRIFIRQPGCIPSPMVTQDGDHQFDGGEKQARLRSLPRPQLQGSSSSLLERRARRARAYLCVGWRSASSSGIRGRKPSSSSAEEASSSHAGEGELLLPGQGAAFRPLSGRLWPAAPGVAQHVVRREGGTRVLGRSHSCFCGEDESEDLPVRFGAAAACWCGVGGQVAAGGGFSADGTVGATCALGLRLFHFNGWLSSPTRGHERGPSSGSVRPGAIAVDVLPSETEVVAALLAQQSPTSQPEFVVPQSLRCGGCSYPREWNQSSVCNGTLSAGVCSLWLSGPEHLGIWA